MAQKDIKYSFFIKRSVERVSADRFVFLKIATAFILFAYINLCACGEPEIKLDRAARRTIDTLVNYQLDSIRPILDSLCTATKEEVIQQAVDSIVRERKKKEERLRLNKPKMMNDKR